MTHEEMTLQGMRADTACRTPKETTRAYRFSPHGPDKSGQIVGDLYCCRDSVKRPSTIKVSHLETKKNKKNEPSRRRYQAEPVEG